MKTQKSKALNVLLLMVAVSVLFSTDALATGGSSYGNSWFWEIINWIKEFFSNFTGSGGNFDGGNTVGAPIDGGLLTILGVAGGGYLIARRKKKK